MAKKIAAALSQELKSEITVGGVDVAFFLDIVLEDVVIKDQQQKVLLSASAIRLDIDEFQYYDRRLSIADVQFVKTDLNIYRKLNEKAFNIDYILSYFKSTDAKDSTNLWQVTCAGISFDNASFTYKDWTKSRPSTAQLLDFSNIQVHDFNCQISRIMISADTLYTATLNELSFKERTGMVVKKAKAELTYSRQTIQLKGLLIQVGDSEIAADIQIDLPDVQDTTITLAEQLDIDCMLFPSVIAPADVYRFFPLLYKSNKSIEFAGRIKGRMSNFRCREFELSYGETTKLQGDFQFNGLPDIYETFIHMNVKHAYVDIEDVRSFRVGDENGGSYQLALPAVFANLGNVIVKGRFTGFVNDFVSYGSFKTDVGFIKTDVVVKNLNNQAGLECIGNIEGAGVHIGKLAGSSLLGKMTFHANLNASGFTHIDKLNVSGKMLIDSVEVNRYIYRYVDIDGNYSQKRFAGNLTIDDKNLNLSFAGMVDLRPELPVFDCSARIRNANLTALHLLDRDSSLILNSDVVLQFEGVKLDDIAGKIHASGVSIETKKKTYNVKSLSFAASRVNEKDRKMTLHADFIHAEISGQYTYAALPASIMHFISYYLPSLRSESENAAEQLSTNFSFFAELENTALIKELFLPDLFVAPNTSISGSFDKENHAYSLAVRSKKLGYGTTSVADLRIDCASKENAYSIVMGIEHLFLKDSLSVDAITLNANVKNDSINYALNWANQTELTNKGQMKGLCKITDANTFVFNFFDSYMIFNDSLWTIANGNTVKIDSGAFVFHKLEAFTKSQLISVNGEVSTRKGSALSVGFQQVDLSNFDWITNQRMVDFDGIAQGDFQLSNVMSSPGITSGLEIKGFAINGKVIGDAAIDCEWLNDRAGLKLNMEVFYKGNIATSRPLLVTGYFYPEAAHENFDLDIYVTNLNLKTLGRYFDSFTSQFNGYVTGKAHLGGSLADPELAGKVKVLGKSLKIDYLGTTYSFVHEVTIAPRYFQFDNLMLSDEEGNQAICSGKIAHHNFYDWNIDIDLTTKRIFCLNTTIQDNIMYYGKGYASGKAEITGTAETVYINANVKTEKGTQLFIPLSTTEELSEAGFISFKSKSANIEPSKPFVLDESGIGMNCVVEMTPDAEVQMIFDEKIGDIIKGRGTGNLELSMTPTSDFTMFGDFTIERGDYLFTLQNLINKHFDIRQGGTIKWNGDPYDAIIDLDAVYKLRAPLYDLISTEVLSTNSDSSYVQKYKRRYFVECELDLQNKLFKPDIAFNIVLPNIDDETKRYVDKFLSQDNQQELSMQTFSLLVMNRFMQPASVRESNLSMEYGQAGTTTSTEMLFNQVSNWLSKISNDFDVGVNYRPGDKLNNQELEVALSTQLFNDRVLIDGNIGTPLESDPSKSSSNIVGVVNVEYKLTADGRFRVKAFNRSNHDDLMKELSSPYTQGLGLSFRKDFNSVADIFRRKKKVTQETN